MEEESGTLGVSEAMARDQEFERGVWVYRLR